MLGTYASLVARARRRDPDRPGAAGRRAGVGAGRDWRRRSGSPRSARSPGGRCACRARAPRRPSPACSPRRSRRAYLVRPRRGHRPTPRGGPRRSRWPRSRSPRCRSSSRVASGSSAPASTRTCPSTCSRSTGSPPAASERLIADGYPLGPHAIVVALVGARAEHGRGVRRPDGRDRGRRLPRGARAARAGSAPWRRIAGALCAGFAYLVAAYLVQGAFKETMQALFLVAFAIGARRRRRAGGRRATAPRPAAGAAAGGARGRQRLRLQLPRAALARGRGGGLGRDRARCAAARRGGAAEARLLARLAAPTALARGRGAGRRDRPRARADRRLRLVRDLRPGGRRARQPVQPPLAARGARDLAVGRLPRRARRRGGAGDRLLPRAPRSARRRSPTGCAGRSRRGERALPAALAAAALLWLYALVAGTPVPGGEGAGDGRPRWSRCISVRALVASRAPALVALAFLAAAGGSSVLALVERAGRAERLLAGAGRRCAISCRRARPWSRRPTSCSPSSTGRTSSPGSCAATASASSRSRPRAGRCRPGSRRRVTVGRRRRRRGRAGRRSRPRAGRTRRRGPCPLIPDAARADPSAGG